MFENNARIIKHKVGLLNLAEELGNVSKACKDMGLSRDTFYRYKAAVESGGVESLFDKSRRQPNLKKRVDATTEQAVLSFALDFPAYGQLRVSHELRKVGLRLIQWRSQYLATQWFGQLQRATESAGSQSGRARLDSNRSPNRRPGEEKTG